MKHTIKYIGLFLFLLFLYSCSESQPAPTQEENPVPVSSTVTEEDNTLNSSAAVANLPEEAPVSSIEPYELTFTTYEADWYEFDYPENFSVRKQKNEMEEEDPYRGDLSLFLTAPDKKITFFAFPIYGNSKPKGMAIDEATEEYVDNSQHQKGSKVTIRAKDGSYTREYQYDDYHFWGQQYDNPTTKALYATAFERFYQSIAATAG